MPVVDLSGNTCSNIIIYSIVFDVRNRTFTVSGLFWVPGATAGIYGIQNAGLAVSAGTWSSLIVMSSFCWGILVFHEQVKNKFHALLACFILIIGLVGMSVYSAPLVDTKINTRNEDESIKGYEETEQLLHSLEMDDIIESSHPYHEANKTGSFESKSDGKNEDVELIPLQMENIISKQNITQIDIEMKTDITRSKSRSKVAHNTGYRSKRSIKRRKKISNEKVGETSRSLEHSTDQKEELVHLCGRLSFTKRQLGLIGAIVNGVWGSNNMIPMHYARYVWYGHKGNF